MKLIGSLTSPYVRKVRIVLAEKRLDCQFVQEDVWADETTIALSNPLGKVPCLILEESDALYDSRVIVEYLDTLSPVGKLIPASGRERAGVKMWEALADGVLDAGVLWRLEATWPKRSEGERSATWMARQRKKVEEGIAAMAKGLGEKPFCSGISMTLSDIGVGCALGWISFRHPEIDWRNRFQNLVRLYDKLMRRPSFADTQPA
ncbi:MAG: glutathione S-transferase N-terminal domain-containing protein [Burkholderiaceae bacterium]|jgi:glutathione S-transferase|nr:glutathione S-transferase N-terminal domain-containing protein [Burkholderiaceae bacterium]